MLELLLVGAWTGLVAYGAWFFSSAEKRERERVEVQERFSGIYNSSKDAIGFASPEGVLLDVNDSFCKLIGYSREELLTRKYQDITSKEYREGEAKMIEGILRTGKPQESEKEYIRKDGSRVPVSLTTFVVKGTDGKPIGVAAIVKDVTERKRLQEELLRSEKLAAIGQLAAAVGHEIRNPLGVINNSCYFLNRKLKDVADEKVMKHLKIIERKIYSANLIIGDLLDFARKKPPTLKETDLNDVVMSALSNILTSENIKVTIKVGEIPRMLLDQEQIRRVFQNMILNAVQAMPEGGKLIIQTSKQRKKRKHSLGSR